MDFTFKYTALTTRTENVPLLIDDINYLTHNLILDVNGIVALETLENNSESHANERTQQWGVSLSFLIVSFEWTLEGPPPPAILTTTYLWSSWSCKFHASVGYNIGEAHLKSPSLFSARLMPIGHRVCLGQLCRVRECNGRLCFDRLRIGRAWSVVGSMGLGSGPRNSWNKQKRPIFSSFWPDNPPNCS